MLENIFWEAAELEAHVLIAGHWDVEVEIFDVDCHEFGTWSGDYAVEKKLDSEEIDGGSATVMWVVYSIAAYSEPRLVGVTFFWSVIYHNATIHYIYPSHSGNIALVDEDNGVCSLDWPRHSLCQSA